MSSAELSFLFGSMELLGCGNRSVLEQEDIHHLFSVAQNDDAAASSSFTALLELPPNQAVQLLHSPLGPPATALDLHGCGGGGGFVCPPPDGCLIERVAKFSVFGGRNNSPETMGSVPSSDSCANLGMPPVKHEPLDTESPDNNINSTNNNQSGPLVSDPTVENGAQPDQRQPKRKEREKKVNNHGPKKKSKSGGGKESSEEGEMLPYVHVRARRGQATDSHSLAERARREKINARMKLLQELVPGCNKISGTALVLDEIINHVQSLQRQVEFLSMRLAAVNPRIDINLDSLLAADISDDDTNPIKNLQNGSLAESNFSSMIMPLTWSEVQYNGNRQHYQQQWPLDPYCQPVWVREEGSPKFITPENSLLSYDSSGNSVSLHRNQVKMEL